jgi:hypothetical protein
MENSSQRVADWSKEKFKRYIDAEITKLFSGILDYAEVAVDSPERWKALRSRILKLGNDTKREILKELDSKYTVQCEISEDVVVVTERK